VPPDKRLRPAIVGDPASRTGGLTVVSQQSA